MQTRFLIIFVFIVGIIGFFWIRSSFENNAKEDLILNNHVRFSGTIVSINKSNNHSFGIIGIKVLDTNTKEFADSSNQRIFPYKVKGAYAEFYGYVPISVNVGDSVLLDSDKRIMNIYDSHHALAVSDVLISSDSDDVEFIKKHTKFE